MKTSVRWKAAVRKTLASLRERDQLEQATVVLVGSVARGVAGPESDIDVLVVSPERFPRLPIGGELQVFRLTRKDFVNRLKCGDDFPQWAVRYGKVISDESHWWEEVQRDPALHDWPDWRRKRDQARERLRFATPLRESGDLDHAHEELLLSARHLGRALLLKERKFPLSQPELPGQLREVGQPKIADLLDSLVDEAVTPRALEQAERAIIASVEKLEQ